MGLGVRAERTNEHTLIMRASRCRTFVKHTIPCHTQLVAPQPH